MEMLGLGLASMLSGAAAVTDRRTYRIPNALNGAGCICLAAFLVLKMVWGNAGVGGIANNLEALAVAFCLMFVVYLLGGIGAGDVKLLGVVGGFAGMESIKLILVLSFVFGAVYGVAVLCRRPGGGLHRIHFSYAIFMAVVMCTAMTVTVS
jgi:Flp pilus assembly protein protease CpaA